MNWSEKVMAILDVLKINQKKLADLTGQKAPYVSEVIKGKNSNPSAKFVAALADLGISARWLLQGEGDIISDGTDNTLRVPLLDVRASAGNGVINDLEVLASDVFVDINKALALTYANRKIFAIKVSGDSMEPTFKNGDIVFVAQGLLDGEGIYVVLDGDVAFIKRVQFLPEKNQLILISDNRLYPPRIFDLNNYDNYIRIFGGVIGVFQQTR